MRREIESIGTFRGFPVMSKTTPAEKGSGSKEKRI